MGVLNVTPDSFSDGGAFADFDAAVARGRELLEAGAAILDVGGESTRPGAEPVSSADEIARCIPVLDALAPLARSAGARLSIDTRDAEVADAACRAGATIVNDVSARLEDVAAAHGATWVAMHMRGEPRTMQRSPTYDDVTAEVADALADAISRGTAAGLDDIWIDPGIGFGKTFEHNWQLLRELETVVALGRPVVVGTSRKGFLGAVLGDADGAGGPTPPRDRLEGSLATAVWAARCGAAVIRAHDVVETVGALATIGEAA